MATKLVDLSMSVDNDMVSFPKIIQPTLEMYQSWEDYATQIGAAEYGVTWLTATYRIELSDHTGTHMDALRHMRDNAGGPESIPLEYCFGNGVVLDLRHKRPGDGITVQDLESALSAISYTLQELDIVLIMTGAGAYQTEQRYLTDHSGFTAPAIHWLLDRGIKMIGVDAITLDPPVWAMFERKQFWEAHRVMLDREFYHVENLTNLDKIPQPFGFKVSLFPVKWVNSTGAPVRAVALIDD